MDRDADRNEKNYNAFLTACHGRHLGLMNFLLEKNVDVNCVTNEGNLVFVRLLPENIQ